MTELNAAVPARAPWSTAAACVAVASVISLLTVLAPWPALGNAVVAGLNFAVNGLWFYRAVVAWVILTSIITLVCLSRKGLSPRIVSKVAPPVIFSSIIVAFFGALLFGSNNSYLAFSNVQVAQNPSLVLQESHSPILREAGGRWKQVDGRDRSRWITTEMGFIACEAFASAIRDDREFVNSQIFINSREAIGDIPAGRTYLCSSIMSNLVEIQVTDGARGDLILVRQGDPTPL